MEDVKNILEYFIKYETYEKLSKIELKKDRYINIKPNQLYNKDSLCSYLNNKKAELVLDCLKSMKLKDEGMKREIIFKFENNLNKGMEIDKFFNFKEEIKKEDYQYVNNYFTDERKIESIILDDQIHVYYPILSSGKSKIPLIDFELQLDETGHIVINYNLLIEGFRQIICEIIVCELSDVEVLVEDFNELYKSLQGLESGDVIKIVELIEIELKAKFKEYNFNSLFNFKYYSKWAVTEEMALTMDCFDSVLVPPFEEEIKEVVYESKKNKSKLLNQFLLGKKEGRLSDEYAVKGHYGSFTDKYPINKKQAKVLTCQEQTNLLAVSGPPGTGKTTVIKEVIANNIVNKALQLIAHWDEEWSTIGIGKQTVSASPFNGRCDYSMIITSSNNEAVDNIGIELLKEIEYFKDVHLLEDYKGILCARLGKKDNIKEFISMALNPLIDYLKQNSFDKKDLIKNNRIFLKEKEELDKLYVKIENYYPYRDQYIQHLLESELIHSVSKNNIDDKRVEIEGTVDYLRAQCYQLKKEAKRVANEMDLLYKERESDNKELQRMSSIKSEKQDVLDRVNQKYKIWFFGKYLVRSIEKEYGNVNELKKSIENLDKELVFVEKHKEEKMNLYNTCSTKLEEIKSKMETNRQDEVESRKKLAILNEFNRIEDMFLKLKELGLSDVDWDSSVYELINCPFIVNIRYQLFLQALTIRQNYIKFHSKSILVNLKKVFDERWFRNFYRPNFRYDESYQSYLKEMWETLFLCFPVVTTTMYSFSKKTFPMIQGLFDQLLIDEAGQALLHHAVGPLYRCRRAMIVGDVFQLEPIYSNQNTSVENSSLHDQEKRTYDINENSVQSLANLHTEVFDILDGQHLGILLEEHRRCEQSIVEFSNQFVYDRKLIIHQKDTEKEFLKYSLCMIDVRAIQRTKAYYNKSKIDMCKKIVDYLVSLYGEEYKEKIGIITPYRNQSIWLQKEIPGVKCGTVHVFQGQEKEVILFSTVVGGKIGYNSMGFAGDKSNNLNVAFTRAKKQLISVGNYSACNRANNYMSHAMVM